MSDTTLKVRVKRIDPSLPLPRHETPGSVGFDLLSRKRIIVPPAEIRLVPANVVVAVPPGYMLMIAARSSLPLRKGLMIPNGVGIVDQDYCGPEDEIQVQGYNFSKQPVDVEKGERIAQGILVRVDKVEWMESQALSEKSRGGFGSTGGT